MLRSTENGLTHSLPLKRLRLPRVFSNSCGFAVTARRASFLTNVIGASSASSAMDMHDSALAFAEGWCTFSQQLSPRRWRNKNYVVSADDDQA